MEKLSSALKIEITVGQFITGAALVLASVVGMWINVNGRISALEIQVQVMQQDRIDNKAMLKEINSNIVWIRVELQNKKNRDDVRDKHGNPEFQE